MLSLFFRFHSQSFSLAFRFPASHSVQSLRAPLAPPRPLLFAFLFLVDSSLAHRFRTFPISLTSSRLTGASVLYFPPLGDGRKSRRYLRIPERVTLTVIAPALRSFCTALFWSSRRANPSFCFFPYFSVSLTLSFSFFPYSFLVPYSFFFYLLFPAQRQASLFLVGSLSLHQESHVETSVEFRVGVADTLYALRAGRHTSRRAHSPLCVVRTRPRTLALRAPRLAQPSPPFEVIAVSTEFCLGNRVSSSVGGDSTHLDCQIVQYVTGM
eukprot:4627521-Pleurochrysis_carterae.AAC.1